MMDSILAVVIGFFDGLSIPKQGNWNEQSKMYDARLQEQANAIEYYKKLTKSLVAENTQLRKEQEK